LIWLRSSLIATSQTLAASKSMPDRPPMVVPP